MNNEQLAFISVLLLIVYVVAGLGLLLYNSNRGERIKITRVIKSRYLVENHDKQQLIERNVDEAIRELCEQLRERPELIRKQIETRLKAKPDTVSTINNPEDVLIDIELRVILP